MDLCGNREETKLKEETKMAMKYLWKCSASLVIKETQIKNYLEISFYRNRSG